MYRIQCLSTSRMPLHPPKCPLRRHPFPECKRDAESGVVVTPRSRLSYLSGTVSLQRPFNPNRLLTTNASTTPIAYATPIWRTEDAPSGSEVFSLKAAADPTPDYERLVLNSLANITDAIRLACINIEEGPNLTRSHWRSVSVTRVEGSAVLTNSAAHSENQCAFRPRRRSQAI